MSTEIPSHPPAPKPVPAPALDPTMPASAAEPAATTPATLPLSPLAKRAGQFALIGLLINVVANGLSRALDGALTTAAPSTQITIGLIEFAVLIISRLALIVVIVFALRFAVQALPQTAPGSGYSGRARAIVTFIACGVYVIGLIYTAISLFLLF